jgi:hypothetical protein
MPVPKDGWTAIWAGAQTRPATTSIDVALFGVLNGPPASPSAGRVVISLCSAHDPRGEMDQPNPAVEVRTFSECEPALDDRPIRQGDIIRFQDPYEPWERLGVIVTGDCDIARNKHAGRLTYVPLLTAHDYLSVFWLPRRLDAIAGQLGERLVSAIRKLQQSNLPQFSTPVTSERARQWTVERGPAGIADALRLGGGRDRDAFLKLAQAYVDVVNATDGSFGVQSAAPGDAYCVLSRAPDHDAAAQRIGNELENYLANLPGDALFLSRVASDHAAGYICYLRVLRDIADGDIAIRPRQALEGARACRVAHLRSPYLYRLTQQLAEVFTAIGLPEEYEESRSRVAKVLLRDRIPQRAAGGAE